MVICILLVSCSKIIPSSTPSVTFVDATPFPSLPSPIPTTLINLSQVPISTLSTEESLRQVLELYETNGNCELPCWWGITPGKTSWLEASQILAPLGTLNEDSFRVHFPKELDPLEVPLPEGYILGEVATSFFVENEVIRAINVNSRWVKRSSEYSLAGILSVWGEPDDIWIRPFPESITGIPHYDLNLLYSKKGLVLSRGVAENQNGLMIICPQNVLSYDGVPPWFILWSEHENVTFSGNDEILRHFAADFGELFVELNDLTGITTEQFYKTYINPGTSECIRFDPPAKP